MTKIDTLSQNLTQDLERLITSSTPQKIAGLLEPDQTLGQLSSIVDKHLKVLQQFQNDLVKVMRISNLKDAVTKDPDYKILQTKIPNLTQEIQDNKEQIDQFRKVQKAFKALKDGLRSNKDKNKVVKDFLQELNPDKPITKPPIYKRIWNALVNIFSSSNEKVAQTKIQLDLLAQQTDTNALVNKATELQPALNKIITAYYNPEIRDPAKANQSEVITNKKLNRKPASPHR